MLYKDMPKATAERIIAALQELHPEVTARIVDEDPALFKLGLIEDIPCQLELGLTQEEAERLYDEIISMEIDAYNYTDKDLRDPVKRRQQKEYEHRYLRFAFLEPYLFNIMKSSSDEIDIGKIEW